MSTPVEQQIVNLLQNGHKQAISLLYENYADALYGVILKVISDPDIAEDALQETFVKVWKNAKSYGVSRQAEMRELSEDDGYVEPHMWTGIGRGRSGCGAALVGNPDQIVEKLNRYMDMGIRAFIFSGYPHKEECERFAKLVLPKLKTFSMPIAQGKVGAEEPSTPLAAGVRI